MKEAPKKSPLIFFQELFIYYWVTSIAGHYLEVLWAQTLHIVTGTRLWQPSTPTIIPLAPPYGFGSVAVILLTLPLIRKYKLHPFGVFILNIFITGSIEYLCASILVLFAGHNRYWNYVNQPYNINGYVCLESAVLFSIAATFFIYFIYPILEKMINKLKKWQFKTIFWVLFITCFTELLVIFVFGDPRF